MKKINLESDLNLICVRAKSFPQGIENSFKTIESKVPTRKGRECYGIYEENENGITYRAGMLKKMEDEDKKYDLENYVIEKGKYLGVTIYNWNARQWWEPGLVFFSMGIDRVYLDTPPEKNINYLKQYPKKKSF